MSSESSEQKIQRIVNLFWENVTIECVPFEQLGEKQDQMKKEYEEGKRNDGISECLSILSENNASKKVNCEKCRACYASYFYNQKVSKLNDPTTRVYVSRNQFEKLKSEKAICKNCENQCAKRHKDKTCSICKKKSTKGRNLIACEKCGDLLCETTCSSEKHCESCKNGYIHENFCSW